MVRFLNYQRIALVSLRWRRSPNTFLVGHLVLAMDVLQWPSYLHGKKKRSVSSSVYRLLVDDTMEKIIVTVSSENSGATINLKDPRGSFVTSGKSVVFKVTIFELENPSPGIWQLVVPSEAGKHTYLLKGSSRTNVVFDFIFAIPRQMEFNSLSLKRWVVVSYLLRRDPSGYWVNFNFQWTKTLYQNNSNNIAFFFTFFNGYRCN